MRKGIFTLILIIILVGGTYFLNSGREGRTSPEPQTGQDTIQITGLVENPYNLTYDDLASLPSKNVTAVLYCVDSPNRPRKNGTWTGVPLKLLLERASPNGGAFKVALYASDGYTTDLYLASVMQDEDIIVAYEFNGEPISPRLVVPGRWDYKWIKYITKIELVSYNFLGTWESAG
jgi:DMSO/TMAO reductase YedYZ molybdopterin-dependent catalytic subunit